MLDPVADGPDLLRGREELVVGKQMTKVLGLVGRKQALLPGQSFKSMDSILVRTASKTARCILNRIVKSSVSSRYCVTVEGSP
jgi:hypothetical protein